MGQLFDKMTAGLPPNPNRGANWMAVGAGLSQLAQGGPVDLSQHYERIQQNKGMTGAIESLREELGPERYKALLNAPPAIQKAIVSKWYEQQFSGPAKPQWIPGVGFVDPNNIPENLMAGNFVPSDQKTTADERRLTNIMSLPRPGHGRNYTREEAVVLDQMLELTNDGQYIYRGTNKLWDGTFPTDQPAPAVGQPVDSTITQTELPPLPGQREVGDQPETQFDYGDPKRAFGFPGIGANIANTLFDAVNAGRPFPETGEAIDGITGLGTMTGLALVQSIEGRPNQWTQERLDNLMPQPGWFQGPDKGLSKVENMVGVLENEITIANELATSSNTTAKIRSDAGAKLLKLRAALKEWETLKMLMASGNAIDSADPEIDAIVDRYLK